MSHFAKVIDGIVTEVIVAEQDFIDTLPDSSLWIQTSYNTFKGQHKNGETPLRKNFAGIGYTYDYDRDAFIPPKIHSTWILNEDECIYYPPIPEPEKDVNSNIFYTWSDDEYLSSGNGWVSTTVTDTSAT